jgi:hypothetical protein
MLAAKWGIPTLILIREPTDAALSWAVRDPRISVRQALKHYVSFYGTIYQYRHAIAVGLFEEVIGDYGAVLKRVNARFDTHFSLFEHSEDNVSEVFERIEQRHRARRGSRLDEKQISRPSDLKERLKEGLRMELKTREVSKLTVTAEAIYADFVDLDQE